MTAIEKAFERIAEATVKQASAVPCSVNDFVAGLNAIIDRLRAEREAALEVAGDEPE